MNSQMYEELSSHVSLVKGDLIDFRVFKGESFKHLITIAKLNGRHAYGMDTFYGLERSSDMDVNRNGYLMYPHGRSRTSRAETDKALKGHVNGVDYTLYEGPLGSCLESIPDNTRFSVAIIDLLQYFPTVQVLRFIKDKMSDGGLLYFKNYQVLEQSGCSAAIKDFITANEEFIRELPSLYEGEHVAPVKRIILSHDIQTKQIETHDTELSKGVTIALVLRTGGDTYNSRYVNALARNIRDKTTMNVEIVVLTNDNSDIDMSVVNRTVPFVHNFKGWWSKIELFRKGIFATDRVLYFDLDTVLVDNIDSILTSREEFMGIRDLFQVNRFQTGVMLWKPSKYHHIYEDFIKAPTAIMQHHVEGDAGWIRENIKNKSYVQDIYPGKLVSFKKHCFNSAKNYIDIPEKASIICFHGKPRPHTIKDYKIVKHWVY